MVQSQSVLIGGGTGFVGRHLVNLLRGGGAKVRIITRKPNSAQDQISWDTIKNKGIPEDTTAIVNLAGRNILDPVLWTEGFKKEVYDSRTNTNRVLVDAIRRASKKPRAFVTVSGVGYYKPSATTEYDEEWRQQPSMDKDFLMSLAQDWESSSELSEEITDKTRRVVIRSGVVIGSDGGIIKNLLLPFKLGLGGPIGSGHQWFPWIHVDDLANLFKFAILNDHVDGIINGVAPEQIRNRDFAQTFANVLGRPSFIPLPQLVVNILFGSERGDILLKGQKVKSRAGVLGFRYNYPTLHEACKQSVLG